MNLKISSVKWRPFCQGGDELKSLFLEDKDPFILHVHCHGYWWPGPSCRQGTSSHGFDVVLPEHIPVSAPEVKHVIGNTGQLRSLWHQAWNAGQPFAHYMLCKPHMQVRQKNVWPISGTNYRSVYDFFLLSISPCQNTQSWRGSFCSFHIRKINSNKAFGNLWNWTVARCGTNVTRRSLTHWLMGDVTVIFKMLFSNSLYRMV